MERKTEIAIKGIPYTFGYVKDAWIKAKIDAKKLFKQDYTFDANYSILALYYTFQYLNIDSFDLNREEFFKTYYIDLNIGLQALFYLSKFNNNPLYN